MSVYVRHDVWLNTAPDKAENDKSQVPQISRLAKMRKDAGDDEFHPPMPEAGPVEYLLGHLFAVGPTDGDTAISQGDLRNYQDNMGISLSPWECNTLRRLSKEYLGEQYRATKIDSKPPWVAPVSEAAPVDRRAVALRMERAMMQLIYD